jgi:hypothetical protein
MHLKMQQKVREQKHIKVGNKKVKKILGKKIFDFFFQKQEINNNNNKNKIYFMDKSVL